MPSSNGVYSLPPGYLAVTGATIQASQHNPPLEDIAAALTGRLSRDGTAAMTGPVQLVPGTVSVPGAVFSTDPTTGFYKTTSGIGVSVGGVKIAEFLAGGIVGARLIGEIVAYTCTAAPALFVLPFGQTLSRVTYATLWAQAQIEIAAGNTFYNNGDGSTTFGIGDLRGRIPVAWDKMGGSASGRLTTAGSGVDGTTLGAVGGLQNSTLLTTNLPPYTPAGTIAVSGTTPVGSTAGFNVVGGGGVTLNTPGTSAITVTSQTFTGTAQGGVSTPLSRMPPVLVANCILFAGA